MARTTKSQTAGPEKLVEDATMVATLSQQTETQPNPALAKMAELLADKLEEEKKEKDEARDLALKAREAGAKAMQEKRDMELAFQNNCPHMKPWGGPSIGGQRDHQGNYRFICLFCSKLWLNDQLPSDLKIALDRVGGPDA